MKVAEVVEKFRPLEKDLRSTGMAVDIYKTPPVRKDIYAMSVTRKADAFRFWPGLADIDKSLDKRHRQAVLTVHEDKRKISELVSVPANQQARNYVNVTVPGARFTYDTLLTVTAKDLADITNRRSEERFQRSYLNMGELKELYDTGDWKIPAGRSIFHVGARIVEVHQHAPETNTSFLVGMDETAHFICQLPQVVESVDEAHDVLKPTEAQDRDDWKRQGEWFFIPVTDQALKEALTSKLSPSRGFHIMLEWDSSHNVMHINHERKKYAIGAVVDARRGHHKTIILSDWHQVVRNREVEVQPVHGRRQYWD